MDFRAQAAFVVGSVRESCAWLVSAYVWKHGKLENASQIREFQKALRRDPSVMSSPLTRYKRSHGDVIPSPYVDCWTDVDETDHFPKTVSSAARKKRVAR